MFIEAIDKLRCIRNHEDSWLVAKFVEMRERDFREGELACPVCEARYPVRDGVVYFSTVRSRKAVPQEYPVPCPEDVFALAAMLDLSAPDRTIVLCGSWTPFADPLGGISQPYTFVVNGPQRAEMSECIYDVVSETAIPLARGSVDAVALGPDATSGMVGSAVTVLRDGGRLVATGSMPVPEDIVLLAGDDGKWVGRKRGTLIPLRRANQ